MKRTLAALALILAATGAHATEPRAGFGFGSGMTAGGIQHFGGSSAAGISGSSSEGGYRTAFGQVESFSDVQARTSFGQGGLSQVGRSDTGARGFLEGQMTGEANAHGAFGGLSGFHGAEGFKQFGFGR